MYCIIGEPLINMGFLKGVFQWVFTGELTHTVVSSAHTVVGCVVRRRRGAALVNTGLLKLFSSSVHSGCVFPHSGYACFFIGETHYKHGARKVVFQ